VVAARTESDSELASTGTGKTRREGKVMKLIEIGLGIYLALGLLGYIGIAGRVTCSDPEKKPPFWRRAMVVVLWPLAMIGAIESDG
jgi:hypothetical protein